MEKENISSGQILDYTVLRRLLYFVKPYKTRFYYLILLTLLLGVLAPAIPLMIQYTLDHHVVIGDYDGLMFMVAMLFGILFVQAIIQYLHTYLSGWLGQYVIRDIRVKLFDHLLRLRLRFYDKTPIGRLVTRTVSDIETLADVFSQGLAAMISDLLQLVFILIAMFWMDWRLALISLSTLPILVLSTYVFKEKVKVAFNNVRNAVANLNTFVQEHITGMNIVQIFGSEAREFQKFKSINEEHKKANLKSVLYYAIYFPVAEIISAAGIGILVWYGARGVIHFEETGITVPLLIAFIMFINMFFRPIRNIADRFNTLQMGIVSTQRIINLLDNSEHIVNDGSFDPEALEGTIAFDKVWFAYNEGEHVLKNITFSVQKGETIALVGATGAGKSSIVNLLNRFYEINKGSILVDGHDIKEFNLQTLRKNIGVVLQDVFLFSDTIKENITLGNPEITDDQIMKAAEQVGAKKFIEKLPGGLSYNVMERGATLSVGQRQLISFIRVMVYDPRILILDEATSSIDTETEELIQAAIEEMMKGRTSIVIAHRLSTIQKADRILVLDKGEIKEEGTHESLLNLNKYYSQLYKLQYSEV